MSTEKQPEPLDAILADFHSFAMRAATVDHRDIHPEAVLLLCDKIEAAVARERNAHTNDIHDALYMATGIPGNAAAMREALERIVGWCEGCHADACEKVCRPELTSESIHAALAALAAPARNCDRFATADEAVAAFADHLRAWETAHGISEDPEHPVQVPAGAFAWLFAPEGGDHA